MQNGALKLKKHNFSKKIALSICGLAILASLVTGILTSCKTLPVLPENPVNALDLLDDDSAFYIAIPNDVDPELVVRFLQNNIKNLSEKEAKIVSGRVNKVYCGLNHKKNKTQIQISAQADFGNALASKLLTQANGWQSSIVITQVNKSYDLYEQNSVEVCFPSKEIALVGRDIPVMLSQFDYIRSIDLELEEPSHLLNDVVYNYLQEAEEAHEIRFYAGRPQSFLTILTGAQLDLKLDHVCGSFVCDEKYPTQYILNLDFKFKDAKFLKSGRALLTLAFGLSNSNCQMIGDDELIISDIQIAKKQLYKILIL